MKKYHINGRGEPRVCQAQEGGCPFGGSMDHYPTREAAQAAFEENMKSSGWAKVPDGGESRKGVPIGPDEVAKAPNANIPDEVIDIFNGLISQEFDGNEAKVLQKDAMSAILDAFPGTTRQEVYDNHWLDVERNFEIAGWHVVYDKPMAYGGEDYEAHFIFRRPSR